MSPVEEGEFTSSRATGCPLSNGTTPAKLHTSQRVETLYTVTYLYP